MTDITVLWPTDRANVWISNTWLQHLARPGYNRVYAGTDLAGHGQLRPSQYNGRLLQVMWSTQGYGYTDFAEYPAGNPILRIRNAHKVNNVIWQIGQIINPTDLLGEMDSTGNSTGSHDHFEVWLKRAGVWMNIDPLNAENGVQLVNDPGQLIPLDGTVVPPSPPVFTLPPIPTLARVKVTTRITSWINLRSLPTISPGSYDLGDVRPGEQWEVFGASTDKQGNIWLALKKDTKVGWAAGYFNGETWLELVT